MSPSPIVIGVDAGATKTASVAATLDGTIVARHRTGPSAVAGLPDERCLATIRESVAAMHDNRPIAHVVIGLSGVDFADQHAAQHRVIVEALDLPEARLTLVNDSIVALAGATAARRATIVQHGTEPTLAYRASPGAETVFDSLGVADCFDLRHRAVPLIARMIDGRAASTGLREAVLAHCGVPAPRFAEWILREPEARARIMQIAPVIFACWQAGDAAAATLVQRAIDDYVVATVAMAARIGLGSFDACFGGGTIAQGGAVLIAAIDAALRPACPEARVAIPAVPPEEGALALALRDPVLIAA